MDIQVLIYCFTGVVILIAIRGRIHYVADKYEQATDLLKEMEYCYQQISVIVKVRDTMQMEIAALTEQFNNESDPQKTDNKGNENGNHQNFTEPFHTDHANNDYSSNIIKSKTLTKIQIKKEQMQCCENELDHLTCNYNLFTMRFKNIKRRFPLISFMTSDDFKNLENKVEYKFS